MEEEAIKCRLTGIDEDGNLTADVPADCAFIIEDVKPYLRPLNSMTDEEKHELQELTKEDLSEFGRFIKNKHGLSLDGLYMFDKLRQLDWLNAHRFDYRGLIEKRLALEAPEDMY